ncbi:MAG TPA: MaoC family dehydratase [Caulobacteraceae bacterium]
MTVASAPVAMPLAPIFAADLTRFGDLSGDLNPIHRLGPTARETTFGRPVAHGTHLVLKALEALAEAGVGATYRNLRARFMLPVFLEQSLELDVAEADDRLQVRLRQAERNVASLDLTVLAEIANPDWEPAREALRPTAIETPIEAMAGLAGELRMPYRAADMASMFPATMATWGPNVVAHLLGTSRIVGMEAPGLRSMCVALNLRMTGGADSSLKFKVVRVTLKLSLIQLELSSLAMDGTVEALVRSDTPST